jgi:hypothetical protein
VGSMAPWRQRNCRRQPEEDSGALGKRSATAALVFLLSFRLLASCHVQGSVPGPSIEFTRIPAATEGSPDKLDVIEGHVIRGNPPLKLVLYAKTGNWWIQPLRNEPYTNVRADGTWTNFTHVASEYAALLVESGFHPASTLKELPGRGGSVLAVATVKGSDPALQVSKTLWFSGYEWRIRTAPSNRGGGPNPYSANNVWTDSKGALHLQIRNLSGEWTCAEVTLTRSLGYGTYSFVVRDTSQLEPAAALAMFTYDYAGAGPNNREMGVEISPWGQRSSENSQYVVQPYYVPENSSRFSVPSGLLTHSFRWKPQRVSFRTSRGSDPEGKTRLLAQHEFTSGVPTHGTESVRISFYMFRPAKEKLKHDNEVVVEKFEYLP